MFAVLLPTMLPTASPGYPDITDWTLTSSSGSEVPKLMIVRPTSTGVTRNRCAAATAPRTTRSPPSTNMTKPARVWR